MAFLAFSQPKDKLLTLSSKQGMGVITFLNKQLLRSFHTTQAQRSQMSCMKEHLALPPPVICVNCKKCAKISSESTPWKPIQARANWQIEPKVEHDKKRCLADSAKPQPATQDTISEERTPLASKLDLVGKRLRISLYTRILFFPLAFIPAFSNTMLLHVCIFF